MIDNIRSLQEEFVSVVVHSLLWYFDVTTARRDISSSLCMEMSVGRFLWNLTELKRAPCCMLKVYTLSFSLLASLTSFSLSLYHHQTKLLVYAQDDLCCVSSCEFMGNSPS